MSQSETEVTVPESHETAVRRRHRGPLYVGLAFAGAGLVATGLVISHSSRDSLDVASQPTGLSQEPPIESVTTLPSPGLSEKEANVPAEGEAHVAVPSGEAFEAAVLEVA